MFQKIKSVLFGVSNLATDQETDEWFRAAVQPQAAVQPHHHEPIVVVKKQKRRKKTTVAKPKASTPKPTPKADTPKPSRKRRRRGRRKAATTKQQQTVYKNILITCNTLDPTIVVTTLAQ